MGWEVETKNDIEFYANKIEKNNIEVVYADKNLCDKRFVEELIFFMILKAIELKLFTIL